MSIKQAADEYAKALKEGQRELKECLANQLPPHPIVLDELLSIDEAETGIAVGLIEIPCSRIIGVKSTGRVNAFTRTFRPLLPTGTEFATKWIRLCSAHLGDEGIRDPIECFEYLGNFYVQEGNKRLSVMRHFGAAKIAANVRRIMPVADGSPRIKAYYEFLDFYRLTGMYDLCYTVPGNYAKLLSRLGFDHKEKWTEERRRYFRAGYHYFNAALAAVGGSHPKPEDALLLWLELHPFSDLKALSSAELKKSISLLWPNLRAAADSEPEVKTEPPEVKGVITQILKGTDHLNVAFIHQYSPDTSNWTRAHDTGRKHLETALGSAVTARSYFDANDPITAAELIEQAIGEGAEVIFTTSPQLISPAMKASVKHPRLRFLNCSVHQPYATVHTYYSRIYEGKFITGAIAGATSPDGRIGYVGSYPIHGVPASINAFALGAQMTNPKARIELKWSCLPGNPTEEFLADGIRIISNRDTPTENHLANEYGTYIYDEAGHLTPLGSPTWVWGRYYENVVRSMLRGSWDDESSRIINHWWGMRSGVIDVKLSPELPEGLRFLAGVLKDGICSGSISPFSRRILDQQGRERCDGSRALTPLELLNMDWLCENVVGSLPRYEDILPISRPMVKLLGIVDKEGSL